MKKSLFAIVFGVFAASSALAAPVVYNLAVDNVAPFENIITGTGSTVQTVVVNSTDSSYGYIDKDGNAATVAITRPNGSGAAPYTTYGNITGYLFDIGPGTTAGEIIPGFNSGLKFTFSSPVNAFGFDVGDWATCCQFNNTRPADIVSTYGVPADGSGLWIAFDGGAATLPANSIDPSGSENPGLAAYGQYTNFIGAIDSSGFFSTITFFGDGFGEVLYAGGTLRFASVPEGSIGVPEPASLALLGIGLLGLVATRRRKVS